MAVILPVLTFTIVGAFDLINAFIASKKVDLAVFRATRAASIPGATDTDIRQAALDEFYFVKSRGIDQNLNLSIARSGGTASVTADISVGKAAYLQPILVRFGGINRNYVRPIEFNTHSESLDELSAKPQPSTQGFNHKKK